MNSLYLLPEVSKQRADDLVAEAERYRRAKSVKPVKNRPVRLNWRALFAHLRPA